MLTIVQSSAIPGKKLIQYLPESRYWYPLAISSPSEGSVIGNPRPRNDSVASTRIAEPSWAVASTISGDTVLGRT